MSFRGRKDLRSAAESELEFDWASTGAIARWLKLVDYVQPMVTVVGYGQVAEDVEQVVKLTSSTRRRGLASGAVFVPSAIPLQVTPEGVFRTSYGAGRIARRAALEVDPDLQR